ncbi:MAG TPA: DinB family protein [Thermomicrobiales bacterium]|jgi:acylphosphatase
MNPQITRPEADEYGSYYTGYVSRVPDGDVLALLGAQQAELAGLLGVLAEEQSNSSFAAGEWTIKEVVGHLNDAERVFSYRAICFARGERAALPSFDQDDYVQAANFDASTLADLLEEWTLLRRANLLAFRQLTSETSQRRGMASGVEVSVRALVFILAGHLNYHLEDLREKYLPAIAAGTSS